MISQLRKFCRFSKRYVLAYSWWYIAGALCIGATQAITVGIIDNIKNAIDALTLDSATAATVVSYSRTIAFLALALMVIRTLSRLLIFTPGRMIEFAIRNDYFAQLLFLQRDFFRAHDAGDLVSRCSNDIGYIRTAYGFCSLQIANVAMSLGFAITAMVHIDLNITLFLAVPMLICMIITQLSIAYLFSHWQRANRQLGQLSSLCLSSYRGVAVIQAYHAEPAIEKKFAELDQNYLATFLSAVRIRALVMPLIQLVGNLSVFLVLWYVGPRVIAATLTLGEIMAFLGYIAMLMPPLLSLGWMLNLLAQAIPAIERLDEVLTASPTLPEVKYQLALPSANGAKLEAGGLGYRYPPGETNPHEFALNDINFTLSPGQVLGIVGGVGSGKTTLCELILRLNELQPGQLWLNGKDAAHCDLQQYRRYFAFAPQRAFLFSASLRDNLKISLPQSKWRQPELDQLLTEYLALAGLKLECEQFPAGLDTMVGEKGVMLSGGQRQRIALARALLKPAVIYVLDDILSAVDYETEQIIIENLRDFIRGKSLIIVSHRVSAVQWADEILVFKDGAIVERGSHRQLYAQGGYYREIFHYQCHK